MGKFILVVLLLVVAFFVGRVFGWIDMAKVLDHGVKSGAIVLDPRK